MEQYGGKTILFLKESESKKVFFKAVVIKLISEGCGDVGLWKEMLGEVALRTRGYEIPSYEIPRPEAVWHFPESKGSTGKFR